MASRDKNHNDKSQANILTAAAVNAIESDKASQEAVLNRLADTVQANYEQFIASHGGQDPLYTAMYRVNATKGGREGSSERERDSSSGREGSLSEKDGSSFSKKEWLRERSLQLPRDFLLESHRATDNPFTYPYMHQPNPHALSLPYPHPYPYASVEEGGDPDDAKRKQGPPPLSNIWPLAFRRRASQPKVIEPHHPASVTTTATSVLTCSTSSPLSCTTSSDVNNNMEPLPPSTAAAGSNRLSAKSLLFKTFRISSNHSRPQP